MPSRCVPIACQAHTERGNTSRFPFILAARAVLAGQTAESAFASRCSAAVCETAPQSTINSLPPLPQQSFSPKQATRTHQLRNQQAVKDEYYYYFKLFPPIPHTICVLYFIPSHFFQIIYQLELT